MNIHWKALRILAAVSILSSCVACNKKTRPTQTKSPQPSKLESVRRQSPGETPQTPMADGWYLVKSSSGEFTIELPSPFVEHEGKKKGTSPLFSINTKFKEVRIAVTFARQSDRPGASFDNALDERERGMAGLGVEVNRQTTAVGGNNYEHLVIRQQPIVVAQMYVSLARKDIMVMIGFQFTKDRQSAFDEVHKRILSSLKVAAP